jgi:hypothetical protein
MYNEWRRNGNISEEAKWRINEMKCIENRNGMKAGQWLKMAKAAIS